MRRHIFIGTFISLALMTGSAVPVVAEDENPWLGADDHTFSYTLTREDNQTTYNITCKNTSSETYHDASFRFYSALDIAKVEDAWLYGENENREFVVGNSDWSSAWAPDETREFTLVMDAESSAPVTNVMNTFSLEQDYSASEDDDVMSTTDPNYNATLDDFDLSDGIESLSDAEQDVYEKLVEETSSDDSATKTLKIRKNAAGLACTEEFELDLSKVPMTKSNGGHYVMQSFYVGSKYIYITQRRYEGNMNVLYIFRGEYSGNTAKMSATDYMRIEKGGHGQTLEIYDYGGKTYLLMDVQQQQHKR